MPGYLGNDPAGSATKIARQTYTTSGAATTDFTFTSGYDVGYLDVYINGVRQTKGTNFTASDGSTFRVLNGGVGAGSTVEATAYKTFNLATVDFDDLGNTGNLTLTGDISGVNATFTGDVSIGGTLTYEDVTNIDSVGVITARSGVDILSGGIDIVGNTTGLNVTGVGTFVDVNVSGAATVAGDLVIADKIVHSGDTNTAIRFPAADTFTVETAGSERLRVDSSGNVAIGTVTPTRPLAIQSDSSTAFAIQADSDNTLRLQMGYDYSNDYVRIASEEVGVNQKDLFHHAMNHRWGRNGSIEYMRLDSSGRLGIGTDNPSQQKLTIDVKDSGTTQASFNGINIANTDSTTNNGAAIIFGQTISGNSFARIGVINSDRTGSSEDQDIFFGTLGGGTYGERLRITSTGRVRLPDDGNLAFGTDEDMLIRHSGSDAVIENTVGHIYFSNYSDDSDINLRSDDGAGGIANYIQCDGSSGAVILNHYGSEKFTTTSTGVEITGTLSATSTITQNGNALATNGKAIAMALIFG